MRKALIGLAFLLPSLSLSAWAENRRVDLSTLSAEMQDDLKKQFPFLKSSSPTRGELDQVLRYLVTQEQYETVQFQSEMTAAGEVYHLNVGRTRRITSLKILGAEHFSESEVRSELGVAEKSVFDQQILIDAGDRLRRLYRERGYRNTVIDLEFARVSATEVHVTLKIREGLQTKVTSVELQANNPAFRKMFERTLSRQLKGEPLTDNLLSGIRKEMREAFSDKRFLKAELAGPTVNFNSDESRAELVFTVANSDQYVVSYKGVVQKSRDSVEKAVDLDHFFSPNPNIGPEIATRVKNYYLNQGYARVEVTGEESNSKEPHQKHLEIDVREGPLVKIKDITITGHYSSPEKYYSSFLLEHSSELIQDGYYNREGLESGLKNLVIDRQNQGYLKAKIVNIKTAYIGEKKDRINITVNLDEGPLTILESVTFEGNASFSDADLLRLVGLQPNEPLRLNQLEEGIAKIKEFYQNSGYLEMNLLNEKDNVVVYNSDSSRASIVLKIYEGPKIVVASILVEGNSITQEYVIMKELEFKPGDTLTPQSLEESTRRLQRLGHFNSVNIKTLEEKTQIAQRTIIVSVTDRDPGLFTLGAGVNSEMGLTVRGYTGLAYRNIMGTGRAVSARLEGNYNINDLRYLENKVTLGYLEPYLFDTRVRGRINYTLADYVSNYSERQGTQLKQITYSLEQDITSHVFLSYDLWSSAQLRSFPIDADNTKLERSETVIVTTGPTVDIDYRDHPFNPTSGSFTRVSAEYASPAMGSTSTIEYIRALGSYTHYKSLYKPGWVWANSLRGGYLRNHKGGGGVPYDIKGLTLGGQSTIRGFQPDEAFPNKLDFNEEVSKYKLTTAATMYLIKSEMRIPIWGAVGAAVFYDGGAVFIEKLGIADPYRDAVGVGLRYVTPLGSVSLDLGYKLDRKEDRDETQWPVYFSIGTF